ncbi:MAG: hypothetical protein A2W19_03580 [Spirochaetes bacterium RBG_16_49_21]|nr:MAG: hypothetical protein A2W19_03580 [Spirochaetes bacterium RBG_16_49_21]
MKISARNVIKGKIKKLTHGSVNSEVLVELAGGIEIVSIITKESVHNLSLSVGKEVYIVIKASNVMIAADCIIFPLTRRRGWHPLLRVRGKMIQLRVFMKFSMREMKIKDYESVYTLWSSTDGIKWSNKLSPLYAKSGH